MSVSIQSGGIASRKIDTFNKPQTLTGLSAGRAGDTATTPRPRERSTFEADRKASPVALAAPSGAGAFTPIASMSLGNVQTAATSVAVPQVDLHFDGGANYNADVEQLQRCLVKAGYLSQADTDTGPGYYGNKTKAAVAQLQAEFGIQDDGSNFGPRTRAALTQKLQVNEPPPPPPPPSIQVPQTNLAYDGGANYNPDVEQLQRCLVKAGYLSQADMDTGPGYYGNKTKAAVARLQAEFGIQDDGSNFGPRTRAALTQKLGGSGPVDGDIHLSPRDAETARRIDQMLANDYPASRMQCMGAVMVDACRNEHIPLDLVMAQLAKESTFLRSDNNLSVANNNPGNLRFADWESQFGGQPGAGNFTHFPSVEQGIRAYVHLLGMPLYRDDVDRRDWASLVHKYAPSSDGNDEAQYAQQLRDWTAFFASKVGIDSNWVNE